MPDRDETEHATMEDVDRRHLERRMLDIERNYSKLMATVLVTEANVNGLIQTQKSRFDAFDRGIELILTKIKELEDTRSQAIGAFTTIKALAALGLVGGIITVMKIIFDKG